MTPVERFAQEHGITVAQVKKLRRLIDRRARECVQAVSGYAHYRLPLRLDELNHLIDREAHSNEWQRDQEATEAHLASLATILGFDGVRYDTHVGTLVKNNDEFHVPCD